MPSTGTLSQRCATRCCDYARHGTRWSVQFNVSCLGLFYRFLQRAAQLIAATTMVVLAHWSPVTLAGCQSNSAVEASQVQKVNMSVQQKLDNGHTATTAPQASEVHMFEHGNKLGPTLKLKLLDAEPDFKLVSTLNLLVQSKGSLSESDHNQLSRIGAILRTEAGDVLTLTLPADSLNALAALDWVVYIELSRPLRSDDSQPPRSP